MSQATWTTGDVVAVADRLAIELIERLAPRAWPAERRVTLDGWTLRRTPGERTRRANSVLPNAHGGALPLDAKLDAVEVFYAGTDVPPRFQMTPLAAPTELEHALEARGYQIDAPTVVMTADLTGPPTPAADSRAFTTVLRDGVDDDWMATLCGGEPDASAEVTRARILQRIEPQTVFARVIRDGMSAAVGLAVVDSGWAGIYCVGTIEGLRRRGAGRAVMSVLLRAAAKAGADMAYLNVLADNVAARGLYSQLGFRVAYGYHYRRLPPAG